MQDYVLHMYPEDDMESHGDYVMYRSYPEFTSQRLAMAQSSAFPNDQNRGSSPGNPNDLRTYTDAQGREPSATDKLTNWKLLLGKNGEKGRSETVGLWMFATDAREPMKNVMQRAATNGKLTLDALFASASSASVGAPPAATPPAPAPPSKPTTGLSLLDSIFASATPPPAFTSSNVLRPAQAASAFPPPPSAPPSTRLSYAEAQPYPESSPEQVHQTAAYEIHSPKPTSSTLPQILNQDVIYSLLGLPAQQSPSSRASSAAPSSTSSRRSHSHYRYEGDVESSDTEAGSIVSAGEYSVTSTVYNSDIAEGLPRLELPNGNPHNGNYQGSSALGDATPRPPLRGFAPGDATPSAHRAASPHFNYRHEEYSATSASGATVIVAPNATSTPPPHTPSAPNGGMPAGRNLVPFHTDSTLWPYPRAPLDDRDGSDADVVELDFADTSALSDMAAFDKRKQDAKGKGRKKGRKERAKDNEREKEIIEKSWDVPVAAAPTSGHSVTASSSTSSSVMNGSSASSAGTVTANGSSQPKKAPRQTTSAAGKVVQTTSSDPTHNALLSAMSVHMHGKPPFTERRELLREILLLIHTDDAFNDNLWKDYRAQTNQ
ncbi:hypothetical protein EWM64_g1874 [Hericium alpestre]|uniref:Uncharacterized protein n=1 Tax=Hericium alpestre TaxID=135208 RepID=A0A4Z0A884_9AGAM|nr:hypothetical protein EWM64_g1874 [Hericium alpestre]